MYTNHNSEVYQPQAFFSSDLKTCVVWADFCLPVQLMLYKQFGADYRHLMSIQVMSCNFCSLQKPNPS